MSQEQPFHFIDLALRPLEGIDGARDLARGELMDRLAHAGSNEGEDDLEKATACLERLKPWRRWLTLVSLAGLAVLLVLLAIMLGNARTELIQLNPVYGFFHGSSDTEGDLEKRLVAGLNAEDRLFVLARWPTSDKAVLDWADAAWQKPPADPGLLDDLIARSGKAKLVPPDRLHRLGAELDPHNGFWQVSAALELAQKEFKTRIIGSPSDRALHEKICGLIDEAAAKPRLESPAPKRAMRRLAMLGIPESLADQVDHCQFMRSQFPLVRDPDFFPIFPWLLHSAELVAENDISGWREWERYFEKVILAMPSDGEGLGGARGPLQEARGFAIQARKLGLAEEADRLDRGAAVLAKLSPSSGSTPVASPHFYSRYASTLIRTHVDSHPQGTLNMADLVPGRMAEHAVADRFAAWSAALLFGLLAIVAALEGWRRQAAQRGLGAGIMPLLRGSDALWVAGLGILLPFAWHILIVRLTPLGCRDFSFMEWHMMPAMQQIGGSFLFACCTLLQTARWRVAKRAGFIGLRTEMAWIGWAMAAVAALFVPAMGMVRVLPRNQQEIFLALGSSMAGMPLLWLIWTAVMAAIQPAGSALRGVVISRVLLPAFTAAAGLCLLTAIPLRAEEKKWVAQDTLGGPDPGGSFMQAIEAKAEAVTRRELQQAWR